MPTIEKKFDTYEQVEAWVANAKNRRQPTKITLIIDENEINETDGQSAASEKDPAELFLDNIDQIAVSTGISDLAEHHDHYLYGTSKI